MKRENGFYWVKQSSNDAWEVMRWDKGSLLWSDTFKRKMGEYMLHQINEERIKNPDEK
jgi:hypothetical protein